MPDPHEQVEVIALRLVAARVEVAGNHPEVGSHYTLAIGINENFELLSGSGAFSSPALMLAFGRSNVRSSKKQNRPFTIATVAEHSAE